MGNQQNGVDHTADLKDGIAKRCAKCNFPTKKPERSVCKKRGCGSTNFNMTLHVGSKFSSASLFSPDAVQNEAKTKGQRLSASKIDVFGFETTGANNARDMDLAKKSDIKKARKVEAERLVKWNKMAQRSSIALLQHPKFRSRVEKGIPKQVRGMIWYKLCNIDATRKHLTEEAKAWLEPGFTLYTHYVQEARRNPTRFTKDKGEIARDLNRTFPNSVVFNTNGGKGQSRLERVLFAYSVANPEVGYTQGMNYIVALLLGFMPEEEAFWVVWAMMKQPKFDLEGVMGAGLRKAKCWFYCVDALVKSRLPEVHAAISRFDGIGAGVYAADWVFTLFSRTCPFSFVAKVWDSFFLEGWPVIFSTALAILYKERKIFKAMRSVEDLMYTLRELGKTIKGDKIRRYSMLPELRVTHSDVAALQKEFELQAQKDGRSPRGSRASTPNSASAAASASAATAKPSPSLNTNMSHSSISSNDDSPYV